VVGVGDPFPALTLPDLEGAARELPQLYGDRMTIVVFWTTEGHYAREQFTRIMHEGRQRYAALGVNVVTINVGDSPEVVKELATQYEVTVPCLLDEEGQGFQQVARGLLPRTYLLDAEGRILWFDLEYSRSQRYELHNAVHYHLKQSGA
jgi:peroxiredoxin